MKVCIKCKEKKLSEDFHRDRAVKDGLARICKACKKEMDKTYASKNAERLRGKRKEYREKNKQKLLAYNKEWAKNNADRVRVHKKTYYDKNSEVIRANTALWREENVRRRSENDKSWKRSNQDKVYTYIRKRRALKLGVEEEYTSEDVEFTKELFNNSCVNCGSTEDLEIDHFRPLSKGYALTRENATLLCKRCNSSKGGKDPEDFFSEEILRKILDILEGTA